MHKDLVLACWLAALTAPGAAFAQTPPPEKPAELPASAQAVFTQSELETMVAPVALYPDTLLMQVLVASTAPLDVMKADQYLTANADVTDSDRKTYAEAQDWDESVQVLTSAFPTVVEDMADHVDWTESMGTAMLTQSGDVMHAVQTMRLRAVDNGALVSGPEQQVAVGPPPPPPEGTVQNNFVAPSGGEVDRTVVITPTNPQQVYVPRYDANTIYSNRLGNIVTTTAIAFGTAALIDSIFDDDDDWHHYWGCRDCGGWNGRPIIRDPNINIDGNVNIGNRINIKRPPPGWKPDPHKVAAARDKLERHRRPDGSIALPISKSKQDELRKRLANRPPGQKIDRAAAADAIRHLPQGGAGLKKKAQSFTPAQKQQAIARTKAKIAKHPELAGKNPQQVRKAVADRAAKAKKPNVAPGSVKRPTAIKKQATGPKTRAAVKKKAPARKPVAHRAAQPKKPVAHKQTVKRPTAIKKQASGARTRAASHRGQAHRGRIKR